MLRRTKPVDVCARRCDIARAAPQHTEVMASQFVPCRPKRDERRCVSNQAGTPGNPTEYQSVQTAEQIVSFGQGNLEAMVKSGQIVATGLQDLSKQMAATAQATMDETLNTFRAMAGVRSFREAMDLQTSLARSTMEKTLTQTGHVAETSLKLAEQAIAPLASRMSLAVQSFGKTA